MSLAWLLNPMLCISIRLVCITYPIDLFNLSKLIIIYALLIECCNSSFMQASIFSVLHLQRSCVIHSHCIYDLSGRNIPFFTWMFMSPLTREWSCDYWDNDEPHVSRRLMNRRSNIQLVSVVYSASRDAEFSIYRRLMNEEVEGQRNSGRLLQCRSIIQTLIWNSALVNQWRSRRSSMGVRAPRASEDTGLWC